MKVAVAGGTGFVGRKLVSALIKRGDHVTLISRTPPSSPPSDPLVHQVTWQELEHSPELLDGIEAIVNLAGESISQRWTKAAKQRILQSRLNTTRQLAQIASRLKQPPEVVINASGVAIYGSSEQATFDENSPRQTTDFLGTVVEQWEQAAGQIAAARHIKLRVSVVLGLDGGAFPLMILPYRLFAGGKIGSGRQWLSWIHDEDMVRLILFCLVNKQLDGPVNASSPEPVTNAQFGQVIGKTMKRPHWLPVPAFAMRLLLGEMSSLLLDGQRVLPRQALEHGFQFHYPTLEAAAANLLRRE